MDLSSEFPQKDDLAYLNHAAVAPWPKRSADAVDRFARENVTIGAQHYPEWVAVKERLFSHLCALLNCGHDELALVKSTSEGLSFVANGIPFRAGDEVVISDEEFPSNRIVWEALAANGVTVKEVHLRDADVSPEECVIQALSEKTRVLSISSVQYASGLKMDLDMLGAACKERDILYCVDAIQSLGAEQIDVKSAHIDFLIADGHKWMLGPEGLGVMFVRNDLIEYLRISEFGWHMVEDVGNYDQREWQPAKSARRFECGSPNMLGIFALEASLGLLCEFGLDAVSRNIINNTKYIIDYIDNSSIYSRRSWADEGRFLGIVSFTDEGGRDNELFAYLNRNNVVCAKRGGGIRWSPHFYTERRILDRALTILDDF